jgi:hypothetical protein
MEMLNMLEMEGKLHLVKQKIFKLVRGVRNGDFDVSSGKWTNKNPRQPNTFNPQARIFAKQRELEIELQKMSAIWAVRAIRGREGH